MTKQLLQRALDLAEGRFHPHSVKALAKDLRAEIAKPVEPVAWTVTEMDSVITNDDKQTNAIQFSQRYLDMHDIPLFTTPPDTEGLRRDAARYEWFANIAVSGDFERAEKAFACFEFVESCTRQEIDAAIDAARVPQNLSI